MRIGIDCRKIADFGIGSYIQGLLGGLAELRAAEELVLFTPPHRSNLVPERLRSCIVPETSALYSLTELYTLGRAIERHDLDLFHSPHYVIPFSRQKIVVTIHDLIHLHEISPGRRPLAAGYARWMMRRAVNTSERIFTVSHAVRDEIAERYPGGGDKTVVVPNGVDPIFREEQTATAIDETLTPLGLRRAGYFLFVGNDKPHKNLGKLIEAFTIVRRAAPHLILAIVGGPSKESREGIVHAGYVPTEDLARIYQGALALVQPSLREGFGLPVAEAMASGLPVTCSTDRALVETAGDAALTFDPLSIPAMSGAMLRLAAEANLRAEMSQRGKAGAARFSWLEAARATLKVYREVLSRG